MYGGTPDRQTYVIADVRRIWDAKTAELCLNGSMPNQQPAPSPRTGVTHRILEHLTAVKTRVWMLRQYLRSGRLDPAETEAHLDQIETQVDAAATLAANLQGQSPPPP